MRRLRLYRRKSTPQNPEKPTTGRKKLKLGYKLFLILLMFGLLLVCLEVQMRPTAMKFLNNRVHMETTQLIHETVYDRLAEENLKYQSFVHLEKNSSDNITSIQTNVVALNSFTTRATTAIAEKLGDMGIQESKIPMGVFSGVSLFSGLGPNLSFKVVSTGRIDTQIENLFEGVGINQTRHQIMLNVTVSVDVILAGHCESTEITTSFCIAETIIVGEVPALYGWGLSQANA